LTENTDRQERVLLKSGMYIFSERIREKCRTCRIFIPHFMGWFVYGEAREKGRGPTWEITGSIISLVLMGRRLEGAG
jgi:hypothetical protein